MSSSDGMVSLPQGYGPEGHVPVQSSIRGMTRIDLLYAARWYLLGILAIFTVITVVVVGIYQGWVSFDSVVSGITDFIGSYYPVPLIFVIGFLVMRHHILTVYEPPSRLVQCTDVESQVTVVFMVPEMRFRTMNQPGNPLVHKTAAGQLLYFAKYLDMDANEIGYGWSHVDKWELMCSDRELFKVIAEEYEYLCKRVMYLEGYLDVEASRNARGPMSHHLNRFRSRMGVMNRDKGTLFEKFTDLPERSEEQRFGEGTEEQEGVPDE